jgi:N-ethylmaleimide reductase
MQYLLNQFLCDGVNKRTDHYGGSIENRVRALHEVLRAVIEVYGNDRVAVRISPTYKDTRTYYDCGDSNPEVLYREVIKSLDQFKLAYLLLSEPRWSGGAVNDDPRKDPGFLQPLRNGWAREVYSHKIIGAGGFTPSSAKHTVDQGVYDCVAFGRWFIANPDLPERLKADSPLNVYERKSFYLRDPVKGYIDYPFSKLPNKYAAPYPVMDQKDIGQTLDAAKVSKL